MLIYPFTSDHVHSRFYSILSVDQITVIMIIAIKF